jgi:hypothetical protein
MPFVHSSPGAYPRVEYLLRLAAYVKLGCQGFPGTNTPAYFASVSVTEEKSFITLATSDIEK